VSDFALHELLCTTSSECSIQVLQTPSAFIRTDNDIYDGGVAPPLHYQIHREFVYRPLQFHKRSRHFIGPHDETLSVAMRVHNPDRLPFTIDR